ncbi:CBS domain-containing protein [Sphaerisporangium sp. TRM90804]|uniref:CBS domain-containing protein n=1 Tax=Sphaerisporangium sp. TRM90804 TaxID=3031113 RepID=UPI00244BF3A7|nr:CBS domain-containing protein [Sphaerisporangium sp. TRM90804]MDH2426217.1 CBS domain-containing protein [Sphaerisporangium sp. TRM90804]
MLVHEVMSSPAFTLRREDPIRRAIRLLHGHDITAAPVLGDHGELVGIVSEMDLLCGAFEPDPRASSRPVAASPEPAPKRVGSVMSSKVVTVTENTDAAVLVDLMIAKRVKSVPVVRDHRVVGMVSRRDLMAMLAVSDDALRQAVVTALHEQFPAGPSWEVTVHEGEVELRGDAGGPLDSIADLLARTLPGVSRVRHSRR